jgi:hypothetical protein
MTRDEMIDGSQKFIAKFQAYAQDKVDDTLLRPCCHIYELMLVHLDGTPYIKRHYATAG